MNIGTVSAKLIVIFLFLFSTGFVFSEDVGKSVIYLKVSNQGEVATVTKETKQGLIAKVTEYSVAFGDKVFGPFEYVFGLQFSPIGSELVFGALSEGKFYLFDGEIRYGPYDGVSHVTFSKDGSNLAFAVETKGKSYVHSKNGWGEPFDHVGGICLSPDGASLAYFGVLGQWHSEDSDGMGILFDGSAYLSINGVKKGPYQQQVGFLKFSPDGKNLAYTTGVLGDDYLFVGNEKAGPFDRISQIDFSPDGTRLVYAASTNGAGYIYDGKDKIGPFSEANPPGGLFSSRFYFSSDGKKINYANESDGKVYIHWDDKKEGPFNSVGEIVRSKDGRDIVYVASDAHGKWYIRSTNDAFSTIGPFTSCPTDLVLSPNGNDVVYAYQEVESDPYKYFFLGKEIGPVDGTIDIKWHFSSDGKSLGYEYETYDDEDKWSSHSRVILDGKEYIGNITNSHIAYIKDDMVVSQ